MSSKIKLRRVQAQRKFAQGAFIPHQTNNNTVERRPETHEKPTAPPTIVHNMSAMSLLDQISFQSIHVHEKKLQPVVRLERLAPPQRVATSPRAVTPQRVPVSQRMPPPQRVPPLQKPAAPQRTARPCSSLAGSVVSSISTPLAYRAMIRSRPKKTNLETSALTRKARFKNRTRPKGLRQRPVFRPISPYTTASTSSSMPLAWMTNINNTKRRFGNPIPTVSLARFGNPIPTVSLARVPMPMTEKLQRLDSNVLKQPRAAAISSLASPSSTPLSFLVRNRPTDRVLTNGIRSRVVAKKKLKKLGKKLRSSRRLRSKTKVTDDTDTEDDTPLTLLAKSKSKTANEQPESSPSKPSENNDGYYTADNIVRWMSDLSNNESPAPGASGGLFKVPLPPKERRKKKTDPPNQPTPPPADEANLVTANSATSTNNNLIGSETDSASEIERPPSTCPSERYVTYSDVVTAPTQERELRCKNCKYCSRADKVDKLSKVVKTSTTKPTSPRRRPSNITDIYEFDAEKDGADTSPDLREFRAARAKLARAGGPEIFLDLRENDQNIVLISEGNRQTRGVIKAEFILKDSLKPIGEYNLIEDESLFDQLLKMMDLVPRLRNKEFNKPPSPPPSEVTDVNYQNDIAPDIAPSCEGGNSDDGPSTSNAHRMTRKKSKDNSNTDKSSSSERAMRSSKETPTRSAKTKKSRLRPVPYSKSSPKRATRNSNKNSEDGQPLAASTPVAGPSRGQQPAGNAVPCEIDVLGLPLPDPNKPAAVVREAPVYYPTEAEFNDPIAYFESIMPAASKFGICKVVAPASFKPKFSMVDKIRFNVANQYIARMYIRWGQASKEMCAIKAHLASQRVAFTRAPVLDNLEVDLPRLYRTVQRLGGLKKVIEKKRWGRVAEEMRIRRGNKIDKKLDDYYVRYVLPYDTLSSQEREAIKGNVNKAWHKKNDRIVERAADPLHRQKQLLGECQSSSDTDEEPEEIAYALTEAEDCIVPGRRMTLGNYARLAKNIQDTYFPNTPQPSPQEVEDEYWKIVLLAAEHICIYAASIDTGEDGIGCSKNRNDPFGRHPWNMKMISQNPGNVLHMLGRVLGVTVPTLHLGMVFSTSCWHRDPHGLPWMEYMHSGPSKIWYGIPDEQSAAFRKAVAALCPTACQNKSIWLPSDITMIPPNFLLTSDVSLTRVEQNPNEFIIVFPKAYSSSISTGHTISESVYFATKSWLKTVDQVFQELRDSCEPTMFALEQLLIAVANDPRAHPSLLQMVHTTLASIVEDEKQYRLDLTRLGLTATTAQRPPHKKKPKPGAWQDECEVCRSTLYLSKVTGLPDQKSAVCLSHALLLLNSKKGPQHDIGTLLLVVYLTEQQLDEVMSKLQNGFVPTR